ncbi:MAG TPA: PHP domain-containing protein [Clostridiales bacterium]|nr:PHP domain-containing protein [Clostridiales bacterium]
MYADLHIHSLHSDGKLTPAEIVKHAKDVGLKAISLTDHDTVKGVADIINHGRKKDIFVIPGVELSTEYKNEEIHILGYFINHRDRRLNARLQQLRNLKNKRTEKMAENLMRIYGIDISKEVSWVKKATHTLGRPHLARILMEKGVASSMADAFGKYLGEHCPAYVQRQRMTPKEGAKLIKQAGGLPVLAHPGLIKGDFDVLEIMEQGLEGIEVFHTNHTEEIQQRLEKLCLDNKWVITGGSDCHGDMLDGKLLMGSSGIDEKYFRALLQYIDFFAT